MQKISRAEYNAQKNYKTKDDCPFCEERLVKEHEILHETKYWSILFAKYPYFDIEGEHILLVPKAHREFTADLSEEEFADMKQAEKWIQAFYQNLGREYFSFIRQTRSNKSVEHLHYHYLPGIPHAMKIIDGKKRFGIKEKIQ